MSDIKSPTDKEINADITDFNEGSKMNDQNLESPQDYNSETLSFELAGLNSRAIAFLIDLFLISLVAVIAFGVGIYFIGNSYIETFGLKTVYIPIYLLLIFLASSYFVILNGYTGTTIGKRLMGIRLISDQGSPVGFWQSFVRWVAYYISAAFLFLGFVWSIFDSRSQSWHDKIAGTFVVKD